MNNAESLKTAHIPKIFVICNRQDTAPVWGYAIRQKGLVVIMEMYPEKALDHWSTEIPDLVVIDVDMPHREIITLYCGFRAVSIAPILLFMPAHNETQILEAYDVGVDDVIVKPVSPAIFVAKVESWLRRSWTVPVEGLTLVKAGAHRLDPARRCLIKPDGSEVKLTNLELRLLHLLMSRPHHLFNTEYLVETIWGGYGTGDQIPLKNVVYRLRKKVETNPTHPLLLQTWKGGYSFEG